MEKVVTDGETGNMVIVLTPCEADDIRRLLLLAGRHLNLGDRTIILGTADVFRCQAVIEHFNELR